MAKSATHDLRDDDLVTAQTPRAGTETERGVAVALGGKVQVPDLGRRTVQDANTVLSNSQGNLRLNVSPEGRDGDVVIAQNPPPDAWTNPRTVVDVTPAGGYKADLFELDIVFILILKLHIH